MKLSQWNCFRNDEFKERRTDELPFILGLAAPSTAEQEVAAPTDEMKGPAIKRVFTLQSKGTHVQKDGTKVSCSYFACTQTGCKLKGEPLKELKSGTGMLFRHLKRCNEALWRQLMLASKPSKSGLGEDREEVQVSRTPILKLKPRSQAYSDRVCVLCSPSSCLSRNVCRGDRDRGREWRGECRE